MVLGQPTTCSEPFCDEDAFLGEKCSKHRKSFLDRYNGDRDGECDDCGRLLLQSGSWNYSSKRSLEWYHAELRSADYCPSCGSQLDSSGFSFTSGKPGQGRSYD